MNKTARDLLKAAALKEGILNDPHTAHLLISKNEIAGAKELPGLEVKADGAGRQVNVNIILREGTVIKNPVHLCFGVMDEEGEQKIVLNVKMEKYSSMSVLAHCAFPFAEDVRHIMDAKIDIDDHASYEYFERHIHSVTGGVKVYPTASVKLGENSKFRAEFELLKGRVGLIDINYETFCGERSSMEMTVRIDGKGDDTVKIKEVGRLKGRESAGVLKSRVALRDKATAEVYNEITAEAPYARGHVDCKEIVQDESAAGAFPVVKVMHPKARVTHEAAIGSVDSKQLVTLMSRGLSEEEAVELIIKGLLRK